MSPRLAVEFARTKFRNRAERLARLVELDAPLVIIDQELDLIDRVRAELEEQKQRLRGMH